MRTRISLLIATIILLAFPQKNFAQYNAETINGYINQYKEFAINQMYEHHVPASITLAQGIFESACGTSRLATEGNNHFGIKCHKEWTGDTLLLDDDELQECFRKYNNAGESYNDHSLFLVTRKRYSDLFTLDIMDYEGWAKGLKAAGYATNPQYADRIINLIKTYNIAKWDTVYQERLANGYFKNYPSVPTEIVENTNKPAEVSQPVAPAKEVTTQPENKTEKKHIQKHTKPSKSAHNKVANTNGNNNNTNKSAAATSKETKKESVTQTTAKNSATPVKEEKKEHRTSTPGETVILPTPESAPSNTNYTPQTNVKKEETPAHAAQEANEELPTAISFFSAQPTDFPLFSEKYPFTDRPVYINNRTLFVIAQRGDTYATIAKDVQDTEKKLKKYNNVTGNAKLRTGQVVYIERKSKTGEKDFYTVKNLETLQYISQATAVDLQRICQYNNIDTKKTLKKGDIIKLKR